MTLEERVTELERFTGAISEAQNDKADTDIMNLTNSGYAKGSSLGMPSSRYINLTLGASDSTYTAPANGWVMFTQNIQNGSIWVSTVYPNMDGIAMSQINTTSGIYPLNVYIPVMKNSTFKVGYSGTTVAAGSNRFEFIYAEGEPST